MKGQMRRFRGEQITLATAAAFATVRGKPPWANLLELDAPSATLESITVAFGPKIEKLYIYDASIGASARYQDLTKALTDRDTGTDSALTLNALQTADRIYVGCKRRYDGLAVDVVLTNGVGTANSVGEYFPAPGTVTDLSITDGTDTTLTLAQDGLITWTVPTGPWPLLSLRQAVQGLAEDIGEDVPVTEPLRWMRLRVDAALTDTTVSIAEVTAMMNPDIIGPGEEAEGFATVRIVTNPGGKPPHRFLLGPEFGGVELVSASITSAANLNWYRIEE